jgi:hypothetical protein
VIGIHRSCASLIAFLERRKTSEQCDLASDEVVGPLTRTTAKVGVNGCSMPVRGSNPERVSTSEAARSRWSGMMEGAPGAETATPNRVVEETSWLCRSIEAYAKACVSRATGRCIGADAAVPAE